MGPHVLDNSGPFSHSSRIGRGYMGRNRFLTVVVVAAVLPMLRPPSAVAQQTPISEILPRMIQAEIHLAGPPPGSPFPSHDAHFIAGEQAQLAPYLFNQAIVSQLITLPIGSSSGGFSYGLDASLGIFSRTTDSFGPAFADRALTIGRNRFSFGTNFQHSGFDTFEGKDLRYGTIKFYLAHKPESGAFFEGDVIETALDLRLKTDTTAFFGHYGVTSRLDVGVAVPIVSVTMDASIDAAVLRLATGTTGPTSTIHTFPGGGEQQTTYESGSAQGIGDVLVRAKYRFLDRPGGGLAAGVDLRLPTGDEANLLGTGAAQTKLSFIASETFDKFAPHVNIGYTFSGTPSSSFLTLSDEFNYTAGAEVEATPRVTITGDLIGRSLRGSGRLQEQAREFTFMSVSGTVGSVTKTEFAKQAGNLNLLLCAAGVKFNAAGNLLISANVLFSLTKAGIRDTLSPAIGVEYAF